MKKKKIIILILFITGILILISSTLFYNTINLKEEYDSITYTYHSNILKFKNYQNYIKIKNNSKQDKTIPKVNLTFVSKDDKIIEKISINIGKIPANKEIKMNFLSNKNLKNSSSFTITYDNEMDITKTYQDNNILINDFLETDSMYLFNITNISKNKFETNKLTIEYLDAEKKVILSKRFNVELNSSHTSSIYTLKDSSNNLDIKYIRIVDY